MNEICSNAKEKNSEVYAAVSSIFSLLGLFGLLIGYFIGGSPAGRVVAEGAPILKGSILGVVIEIVRGSILMPSYNLSLGLCGFLPMILYLFLFLLIAALTLSLILTIAAILLPRFSRVIALFQGWLLFFLYSALFAENALLFVLSEGKLSPSPFDLPLFLTAISFFAVLVLTAFFENKRRCVLRASLLAASVLGALPLFLPNTPLLNSVNTITLPQDGAFLRAVLAIYCLVSFCNLALSILRLHANRGYTVDIVRFSLQFFALIALIAASSEKFSFFFDQPLAAIFLLLGCAGGTALSVFYSLMSGTKRTKLRRKRAENFEEATFSAHLS